ncbi:MAG: hypothetical protein U0703_06175 [Anaerolineae bacterium]
MRALAGVDRLRKQVREDRTRHPGVMRVLECPRHLSQHLRFPQDHRVQTAGDPHQVSGGVVARVNVQIRLEFRQRNALKLRHELFDARDTLVRIVGADVDFSRLQVDTITASSIAGAV